MKSCSNRIRPAEDSGAAELYLTQARQRYAAGTAGKQLPGFDAAQNVGIVWEYGGPEVGLVPVPVPAEIHADVLAMRSAHRSLELNPNLDAALSRYLMANLRRENHLPQGTRDPSYGRDMRDPSFYARLAGPQRLHDVLARALADDDPALALDAINALSATAGTAALVNLDAATQPLLQALAYPNRRVRFHAAEALANARPQSEFPEAHRVVLVLAEAVRQQGAKYALVLADDQETLNKRLADVSDLGYEVFGGLSIADVQAELMQRPGVDLIVVDQSADHAAQTFAQTKTTYKLRGTPVVAIAAPAEQYQLTAQVGENPRFSMTDASGDDSSTLKQAVQNAAEAYAGQQISDAEATQFALSALAKLHEIALNSKIYHAEDAQGALIAALDDSRPEVAKAAAEVVTVLNNAEAQQALAKRALDNDNKLQVFLLQRLADSATHYGNLLESAQTNQLLELVQNSTGEKALAAARVSRRLLAADLAGSEDDPRQQQQQ